MHPYAVAITELLCLTGCRVGEIANLQWSEIDDEVQCLRLGDTKTGRSVRPVGKPLLISLTPELVKLAPRSSFLYCVGAAAIKASSECRGRSSKLLRSTARAGIPFGTRSQR
ncbi:tyrosine-type recombinase/integrase [Aureimonas altamirensis]|uniref:tyrosine-type recombinase/integrase n=1 Tax=Aureimonas altamirensis TaxID=370622 RepID=UPI0033373856